MTHSRAHATARRLCGLACLALAMAALLPGLPSSASAESKPATLPAPGAPTTCQIAFSDVAPSNYFYEGVRYLYCRGAVGGYADGTFQPNNPTTRAQLAKILVIADGWPINTSGGPHFRDVPVDHPFYSYIETIYLRSVMSGYSDGTFRPDALISRGQFSKALTLSQGWPLLNPSRPTFVDVPSGSVFFRYVETAWDREVVSGYADSTYRPSNLATRGQISKLVYFAVYGLRLTAQEQQTVDLINQRRAAAGLGGLRVNPALVSAARRHSSDIGPAGLCQHTGTDGSSPWDRIAQAGYGGQALGEVIGCGYTTPDAVVSAWWGSPAHYAVLTDSSANDIGCGWWVNPTNGAGLQTCDTGHLNR